MLFLLLLLLRLSLGQLYNNEERGKTSAFELFKILSVPYGQYIVVPLDVVVLVVVVVFIITILKDDTALEYIFCVWLAHCSVMN